MVRRDPFFLVLLSVLFICWGVNIKILEPVNAAWPFTAAAFLTVAWWFLAGRTRPEGAPGGFRSFVAFATVHTLVTYGVVLPEAFVSDGTSATAQGIEVLRFFFMAAWSLSIIPLISDSKRLIQVCLWYGFGFAAVLAWGLTSGFEFGSHVVTGRFTGGTQDPNHFAFYSTTAVFLGQYVRVNPDSGRVARFLALLLMAAGLFGIVLTLSRGAVIALAVGSAVYMLRTFGLRMVLQGLFVLAVATALIGAVVSQDTLDTVLGRYSVERAMEDRGSSRFDIWEAYLQELPSYGLQGTGLYRSYLVIRGMSGDQNLFTHNDYLAVLVEFGLVGALLFLAALSQLWRKLSWAAKADPRHLRTGAALMALFVSLAVTMFSLNVFMIRSVWLVFGILCAHVCYIQGQRQADEALVRCGLKHGSEKSDRECME